jgi:II/X family phage/plasmid replication protein
VIDWLTCKVPCRLPAPWVDGCTVKLDREGVETLRTLHRAAVPGSHETSILVRAVSPMELEISGNLAKWLQGHNLYGPDCPRELLAAALERLASIRGVDASICFPQHLQDATKVSRIDCTYMAELPDAGSVRTWLRDAYATGSAIHRGRGVFENGTLVFGHARGKSFQHWQLVCYAKGDEIRRHTLPGAMTGNDLVLPWADRMLRLEVRLGRLLLERAGLSTLSNWIGGAGRAQWESAMAKLQFAEVETDPTVVASLPRSLRAAFLLWKNGDDLREIYSKTAFYRLRAGLRDALGVDIATPVQRGPVSNVVPIRRRLEAVLVGRPDWADAVDLELAGQGCFVFPNAA